MRGLTLLALSGVLTASAWAASSSDAQALEWGRRVYVGNCAACHGPCGRGDGSVSHIFRVRPTDLSTPDMALQDDAEIDAVVSRGKKEMPKYQRLLSDADRRAVIRYMR